MILKKRELINILQHLKTFEHPKLRLEQYQTDAVAASDLLFYVAFEMQDIIVENTLMVDLGCGTGTFAVGAALLGARVVAVDVDEDALKLLEINVKTVGVGKRVQILKKDIKSLQKKHIIELANKNGWDYEKIVTITNPPFGVHNKGIDIVFLEKAMKIGEVVYSIHLYNENSISYIEDKIQKAGGSVAGKSILYLTLPHSYKFHKKKRKEVKTIVFRVISR